MTNSNDPYRCGFCQTTYVVPVLARDCEKRGEKLGVSRPKSAGGRTR